MLLHMRMMTERSPRRGRRGRGVRVECPRCLNFPLKWTNKPLQPDFKAKDSGKEDS